MKRIATLTLPVLLLLAGCSGPKKAEPTSVVEDEATANMLEAYEGVCELRENGLTYAEFEAIMNRQIASDPSNKANVMIGENLKRHWFSC
jgi:hypothetical protein